MELLLNRYRNLTVLVIAIVAQLALLAYQVKGNGEVRLIRVWAVSAVTPLARLIEGGRSNISRFFSDYFVLLDVREENKRMRAELERTKLDNQYLQTELSTADRARSLAIFQQQSPSKTVAAHVIGNSTAVTSRSSSWTAAPIAASKRDGGDHAGRHRRQSDWRVPDRLLRASDHRPHLRRQCHLTKEPSHGTLKGQGYSTAMIDYVQNEGGWKPARWFYTSGDDRIFPKGLAGGEATVVRPGKSHKERFT
jgi:rod shape-determining protein MreC